jgi:hypothetical protein|tara:strand:- start:308 stop:622 length:315 start_codon:yes stop_codon:yes gene_type:complete
MANKATAEELHNIRKWINPKGKTLRVSKIEEDGSKTRAHALQMGDRTVFHSEEGPALINKEQKRKEYYLNGIEFTYDDWNEIIKGKEGLPWYKKPAPKGQNHRN